MGRSSKDKRDIYYRLAKEEGWRARSAFKLLHIDQRFGIFKDVKYALDLCAAPGSWSQVLSKKLKTGDDEEIKIVAVDIQAIAPLNGVTVIQGDITKESTVQKITDNFEGHKADLVVCDGAPDVTGLHDIDEYIQSELLVSALNITTYTLRTGGTFVAKIFRGKNIEYLLEKLRMFFKSIVVTKPSSSRNSSIEAFVVCHQYLPPEGYEPHMWKPKLGHGYNFKGNKVNASVIPFLVCGDLTQYDADTNYPLKTFDETSNVDLREVLQKPISPPYEESLALRKGQLLEEPAF